MGAIITRILIFAVILWLIRYVIMSFSGGRKVQRKTPASEKSTVMVKDPVCGMYMDSRLAVLLEKRNETIYFCSEECKTKYLADSSAGKIGK
jgi:YHS domain-containing protein